MSFMDRAVAGEEKFLSVFVWLVVLPYVTMKFIAPILIIWIVTSAETGGNLAGALKFSQILLSIYFLFAFYCLWKCTGNLSKEYQNLAKFGVVLMALWLVLTPLVGLFVMKKYEERLDAQFAPAERAARNLTFEEVKEGLIKSNEPQNEAEEENNRRRRQDYSGEGREGVASETEGLPTDNNSEGQY